MRYILFIFISSILFSACSATAPEPMAFSFKHPAVGSTFVYVGGVLDTNNVFVLGIDTVSYVVLDTNAAYGLRTHVTTMLETTKDYTDTVAYAYETNQDFSYFVPTSRAGSGVWVTYPTGSTRTTYTRITNTILVGSKRIILTDQIKASWVDDEQINVAGTSFKARKILRHLERVNDDGTDMIQSSTDLLVSYVPSLGVAAVYRVDPRKVTSGNIAGNRYGSLNTLIRYTLK